MNVPPKYRPSFVDEIDHRSSRSTIRFGNIFHRVKQGEEVHITFDFIWCTIDFPTSCANGLRTPTVTVHVHCLPEEYFRGWTK